MQNVERVKPGYNDGQGWGSKPKIDFPPLLAKPPRAAPEGDLVTDLIVACVNVGPKFPAHYVWRLKAAAEKHLSMPFRFACITDRPREYQFIGSGVHVITPERPLPGWYSKINLFSPHTFPAGVRVLYFDLDVVITSSIDDLVKCPEPFIMIREFNPRNIAAHNSSVMSWRPPYAREIFDMPDEWMERSWGDQECIWTIMGNERIWDWPDTWMKSYKYHGRQGLPPEAKVMIFHGDPKPDAVNVGWVQEHWTNLEIPR
jgi:hypothetical protein